MSTNLPRSGATWPTHPGDGPLPDEWIETARPVRIDVTWNLDDPQRPRVGEVKLRPIADGDEITATRIHHIPFGTIFRKMRQGQGELEASHDLDPEAIQELQKRWAEPRPGRPLHYPIDHWLAVRDAYYRGRTTGAIRKTIAAEFNVSKGTAKNWTEKIRKMGLID